MDTGMTPFQIVSLCLTVLTMVGSGLAAWFAVKSQGQATAAALQEFKETNKNSLSDLKTTIEKSVDALGLRVKAVEGDLQQLRIEIAKEYVSAPRLKEVEGSLTKQIGELKDIVVELIRRSDNGSNSGVVVMPRRRRKPATDI